MPFADAQATRTCAEIGLASEACSLRESVPPEGFLGPAGGRCPLGVLSSRALRFLVVETASRLFLSCACQLQGQEWSVLPALQSIDGRGTRRFPLAEVPALLEFVTSSERRPFGRSLTCR
jgi:hypothetical protein